jgi:hypothetical protein
MSAADIAEIAADGVADGMHVVSEEALAVEQAVRGFEAVNLAWLGLGLAVGGAIGAFTAWKVAYTRAETKYNEIAAEEIAEMRDHFHAKELARENAEGKGNLHEIIRDRGYAPGSEEEEESTAPPMAVTPPEAVVERAEEAREEEAETPPPPEEDPEPGVVHHNVFADHAPPPDEWDWVKERALRSPMKPYVIHRDEREEFAAYDSVTYTYYAEDDVLCNETDDVIPEEDRDRIVGEANLEKFGHGSGDATIVYVRNNQLEMDMEIVKSPNSYAEEVHGFEPVEPEIRHSARRRERRTHDDD